MARRERTRRRTGLVVERARSASFRTKPQEHGAVRANGREKSPTQTSWGFAYGGDQKTSETNTAFGRQAYVGLEGGFGEVQIGKVWSAYDDVFAGFGVFDADVLAPIKMLGQNGYVDPAKTVKYIAPEVAGFTGSLSYTPGTADASKVTSLSVQYATGPVAVALGYQDNKDASDFTLLTGSYDLGVAKLMAAYQQEKPNDGAAKTTTYNLGVDYPVSANLTLSAAYGNYKVAGTTGSRPAGYSVAFAYGLSKRTTVYGGAWSANSAAKAALDGEEGFTGTRYGVGIRHTF